MVESWDLCNECICQNYGKHFENIFVLNMTAFCTEKCFGKTEKNKPVRFVNVRVSNVKIHNVNYIKNPHQGNHELWPWVVSSLAEEVHSCLANLFQVWEITAGYSFDSNGRMCRIIVLLFPVRESLFPLSEHFCARCGHQ